MGTSLRIFYEQDQADAAASVVSNLVRLVDKIRLAYKYVLPQASIMDFSKPVHCEINGGAGSDAGVDVGIGWLDGSLRCLGQ